MITQKIIAEQAGVSRGTVDRVLNNRGQVNDETRKKILELAKLMNYKPNRAGKALAIQQKNLKIGCIIIQADNPFYKDINYGMQIKADEYKSYGIDVIIRNVVFKAENQLHEIDELIKMNINGLVIQPINEPSLSKKLNEITSMGIPVVTINTDLSGLDHFCYVGNDFYTCGKMAANLMELFTGGKCQIGIVTGFKNAKSHADRIQGFYDYIKNIPDMKVVSFVENEDDEIDSYNVTKDMLESHPEINALFIVAGGVYGACKALKTIPNYHRIKTVCFDDFPKTKELVKDGTIFATVCQQPIRQGELALEVLFNYLIDQIKPEKPELYTDIKIKIKSNIDT